MIEDGIDSGPCAVCGPLDMFCLGYVVVACTLTLDPASPLLGIYFEDITQQI